MTALDIVPRKGGVHQREKVSDRGCGDRKIISANQAAAARMATTDQKAAYTGADIIVISTPTNYDARYCNYLRYFKRSEAALGMALQYAPDATIVDQIDGTGLAIPGRCRSVRGTGTSSSARNFCAKGMHCMTTCIRAALLSAVMAANPEMLRRAREFARPAWQKARWTRTCRPFSPA